MNREDVTKLFRLFSALRPKWKPEKNAIEAWAIVLEPYRYEGVKEAAVKCLRKHSYIPDPAEIIAEIPKPPDGPDDKEVEQMLRFLHQLEQTES